MKTANNQVQDRNEIIDKLNQRCEILQNFYDEGGEQIQAEKDKRKKDSEAAEAKFKEFQEDMVTQKNELLRKIKDLQELIASLDDTTKNEEVD